MKKIKAVWRSREDTHKNQCTKEIHFKAIKFPFEKQTHTHRKIKDSKKKNIKKFPWNASNRIFTKIQNSYNIWNNEWMITQLINFLMKTNTEFLWASFVVLFLSRNFVTSRRNSAKTYFNFDNLCISLMLFVCLWSAALNWITVCLFRFQVTVKPKLKWKGEF